RRARTPAATQPRDDRYTDAVLEVDYARYEVRVRGERVNLTPTEYKILTFLVEQIGRPVPPDRLLKRVWGPEYSGEDLVKWHMAHLRRKIEADPDRPELVVTRRGFGYMYAPQGASVPSRRPLHSSDAVSRRASSPQRDPPSVADFVGAYGNTPAACRRPRRGAACCAHPPSSRYEREAVMWRTTLHPDVSGSAHSADAALAMLVRA
ncbi:MAG: winged helix-turn-helix domain-containing protein, partial [Dehalococcoidia bacterium]